jgi:ABC-type nickel/cobalt efflux system permease component RcnA
MTRLNRSVYRVPWAIVSMGLFLGSIMLLAVGQNTFSLIAFILAVVTGLWMLLRGLCRFRSSAD